MNAVEQPLMCLTEVQWREVGEDDTSTPVWASSVICPSEGELRWARINADRMVPDDSLEIGQKRWLLYEPPYASVNGFDQDENPFYLDLCAVVEVELTQVLLPQSLRRSHERLAWMGCRCIRVVPLVHIADVFPAIVPIGKRASELEATIGRTVTYFFESRPAFYNWYVVTNPKASRHALPHIVLCGSDEGYGVICNWVVECDRTSWKMS